MSSGISTLPGISAGATNNNTSSHSTPVTKTSGQIELRQSGRFIERGECSPVEIACKRDYHALSVGFAHAVECSGQIWYG